MVKVCMLTDSQGLVGFEVEGHAKFSSRGKPDIVCSAVSMLTQTTLIGLTERLKLNIGYEMKDGYMYCILGDSVTKSERESASILFDTLLLGLKSIEEEYGKYLRTTQREV